MKRVMTRQFAKFGELKKHKKLHRNPQLLLITSVSLNHSFWCEICHEINYPAIGDPPFISMILSSSLVSIWMVYDVYVNKWGLWMFISLFISFISIWLVVWNMTGLWLSIQLGMENHPNWLIFFRGVAKNHQPVIFFQRGGEKPPTSNIVITITYYYHGNDYILWYIMVYIYIYHLYPLVNQHSYWKWQFIVDFPIKQMWFSIVMLVYQRVCIYGTRMNPPACHPGPRPPAQELLSNAWWGAPVARRGVLWGGYSDIQRSIET